MRVIWGETTQRILALLTDLGPMTRSEVSRLLNVERDKCAAIFSRLSRPTRRPPAPRRIHIVGYVFDEEGQRRYPRAIYTIGDEPDAKKPVPQPKETKRRYLEARKARVASVFELGLNRTQRRALGHGI